MKTIRIKIRSILMLFTILISGCVYAQPYMPLPDSNATWIIQSGNSEVQDRKKIFIPDVERDTIINGLAYVKLMVMGAVFHGPWTPPPPPSYLYGPDYYGAYRSDDSGRSYIKFPDDSWGLGDEEILLMDLTVEVGDTIRQLPSYSSYDYSYVYSDLLVDSIDYVVNGPYTRKRIMLTNLNPPWGMECNFYWVEGLGNISSGFQNAVGCGLENVVLTCMNINDTIFAGTGEVLNDPVPGNCYYPYTSVASHEEIRIPLLVYPSPSSDYVIFEQHTSDKNGTISISDFTGRPVASFPMTGEKTVWQTEGVKPGVYLYRLQTAEGRGSGKLLIAP
jgi:hypothetical protein